MSRLDQANFWMVVGVMLGFLLGACCVWFLFWLDRWCTRNLPDHLGPDESGSGGAPLGGDHTVWGDSTTNDRDAREVR